MIIFSKFYRQLLTFMICLCIHFQSQVYCSPKIVRNYDTQHIRLVLNINEDQKSITGIATITITPLDTPFNECSFHAKNLEIQEILDNENRPLQFFADSEIVTIKFTETHTPDESLNISIKYFSIPHKGLYFTRENNNDISTPSYIYTHSEPIDARCWFPCYDEPDDKLTSEVIATVSSKYFLLSNGKLLNVHENLLDQTKTYHWFQDKSHTTYLISITAGEYETIEDTHAEVPLLYYVPPEKASIAFLNFAETPEMITYFSDKFNYRYPWDKYAQIVVPNFKARGMEHTSATTLIDNVLQDKYTRIDFNSDKLIAHELAHQWFGNLVTCKEWAHLWLNEGFATYAEVLFSEFSLGHEDSEYDIISQQQFYLEMEDSDFHQPIVFHNYTHPEELFNHISYQKASQVLHILRDMIGDNLFFKSIHKYLHQYAFQSVETKDFIQIVESVSGQKLAWFFDQWLFHGGHPEFEVSYTWNADSNKITLYVEQTQQNLDAAIPIFQIPVEIFIVTENEKITRRINIQKKKEIFSFNATSKPFMVRFDKNNVILKRLKFIKTQDECIYQLMHDKSVWGRLDAIHQLKTNTIDTSLTIEALHRSLRNDSFWAVRREAVYALEIFKNVAVKDILIAGCKDANSKVRSACLQVLSDKRDSELVPIYKEMAEQDSSYWVVTEALYALAKFPDSLSFNFLNSYMNRKSYNDMIVTAAFEGLRELKDKNGLTIAQRFAADAKQPFSRRYSALRLIEDVGGGDSLVERFLIKMLDERDDRIKQKVIQIIGNFKTNSALQALEKFERGELSDGVRRRVQYAMKKIRKAIIEQGEEDSLN